ncbi:MAG: 3-methyladenine DNA glycosylase [Helicobacter sp.]|nr:3-methyladenine DNA glycosylase [Helicobacteraceae bacterium]MDY3114210.1 3-methyladenine DNA glycosylase [Helicobacter sp.]
MEITNSYEALKFLKKQNLLEPINADCDVWNPKLWWWPNALSFEIVVGTILVQNTRWEQVEIALKNIKDSKLLSLESLAEIPLLELESKIKSVGFFRQKAKRLKTLCQNILSDFGDFENFKDSVSGEWLIAQKGIGNESRDGILNYALGREVLVVDAYTKRFLEKFGFCFNGYEDMQEWLMDGILENYKKICELYSFKIPLSLVYARFHGKIVEYVKKEKNGKI